MAQAVSLDTRSTFLAQLFAQITVPPAERRLLAELRREAGQAWSLATHRFYAAMALRDHHVHARRAAEIERRSFQGAEAAAEARAQLALVEAVDDMMHVPAPTMRALRQKQKYRQITGGRQRWDAAIAADIARLARA